MFHQEAAFPFTHAVDVRQAMETLDYSEMLALAELFSHWAINEENLDGFQRTRTLQWSADYERIADFVGERWQAAALDENISLLQFVARKCQRDW